MTNDITATICSACLDSLQNYLEFATVCLDWEDKLQKYLKLVGLRKKRKICLETFKHNLGRVMKIEDENAPVDANETTLIEVNYVTETDGTDINIKHELVEHSV